ncbi:hypothetical protein K461DRAFT_65805 [Myriangium duriaei CBS 260.36]|uniref:2EXR domain-containing protein n=1 Tax=Myriangium duriaei CBS 260.36 TaxID=1168546 RepID=A0A9P4IVD3_9PEZI|nr:hypothetical protein K461DRAFT_65805 [Myriangium duriaei CBS 260.36]
MPPDSEAVGSYVNMHPRSQKIRKGNGIMISAKRSWFIRTGTQLEPSKVSAWREVSHRVAILCHNYTTKLQSLKLEQTAPSMTSDRLQCIVYFPVITSPTALVPRQPLSRLLSCFVDRRRDYFSAGATTTSVTLRHRRRQCKWPTRCRRKAPSTLSLASHQSLARRYGALPSHQLLRAYHAPVHPPSGSRPTSLGADPFKARTTTTGNKAERAVSSTQAHPFPRLPPKLRIKVWELTASCARSSLCPYPPLLDFFWQNWAYARINPDISIAKAIDTGLSRQDLTCVRPAAAQASREARNIILRQKPSEDSSI